MFFPLDDDLDGLYAKVAPKPRPKYEFFPGQTRFNRLTAPDIYRYDFEINADVDLGPKPANGVLLASGDSAAGYEWFMQDGFLFFTYVFTRDQVYSYKSKTRIEEGEHKLAIRGKVSGKGSGALDILVDDGK